MARNRIRWTTWAALAVLALSARPTAAPAAENLPPAAVKEADTIYQTRCIGCHGPGGKGDGPIGMALNPRPRDLSDEAWQKSVADEQSKRSSWRRPGSRKEPDDAGELRPQRQTRRAQGAARHGAQFRRIRQRHIGKAGGSALKNFDPW
jgi:hypothetical protein